MTLEEFTEIARALGEGDRVDVVPYRVEGGERRAAVVCAFHALARRVRDAADQAGLTIRSAAGRSLVVSGFEESNRHDLRELPTTGR